MSWDTELRPWVETLSWGHGLRHGAEAMVWDSEFKPMGWDKSRGRKNFSPIYWRKNFSGLRATALLLTYLRFLRNAKTTLKGRLPLLMPEKYSTEKFNSIRMAQLLIQLPTATRRPAAVPGVMHLTSMDRADENYVKDRMRNCWQRIWYQPTLWWKNAKVHLLATQKALNARKLSLEEGWMAKPTHAELWGEELDQEH